MCYGARAARYLRSQVNHSSTISAADLQTSFAYKLFSDLVQLSNVKMTAVTGKIQHDATTGRAMVEHEDTIDENMAFSDAAKAQTQSKGPLNATYQTLRTQPSGDSKSADDLQKRRANPALPIVTPFDQYARDRIAWENAGGTALVGRGEEEMMPKYGKFIYTYEGGVLKIATKYGKRGDPVMKPMTLLYSGPLL